MNSPTNNTSRSTSRSDEKDVEKCDNDHGTRTASIVSKEPSFDSPAQAAHEEPPSKIDEYDGPDDSENPQNWSKPKKIYHSFVPAAIAFVCTLASSIYTPGRVSVMADFSVSAEVALLPYIFYVLGLAFGPLLAAPLSETFGRRAVYLIAIPIFGLFILGAGFSQSVASLTVCRFFAGVFGSPGLSIGSATLADIWKPHERTVPMALYITTPFLGPALGPLLGGYTAWAKDWRWTEWTLLFFTVVCLTPALGMKETYKSTILKRRAEARGLKRSGPQRSRLQAAKFFVRSTLTRPVHMAVVEPVVGLFTLYIAVNFAMLYCFFAAFPFVFERAYDFGIRSVGLTFLGLGVGCIMGCLMIILMAKTVFKRQVQHSKEVGNGGKVAPETRLYLAMIGSICLPFSLFWFGWTARSDIHWISPVVAEGFFGCGNLLVFMSAVLYLMDFYGPLYGASAMGANNLARYVLGAAFPLFAVQMYERLGIGWATSLLAFISLALTPIPWVFFMYGPKLRAMSKYQRST